MRDLTATPVSKTASVLLFLFFLFAKSYNVEAKIQFQSDIDQKIIATFLSDLREKTGLKSLALDRDNFLVNQGSLKVSEGSKTMRFLISGAMDDSRNMFLIIDDSESQEIQFSRTDQGTINIETGKTGYLVSFDFKDFEKSRRYSSDEALGSFSFGINLFHEIDHKVSYDPDDWIPINGVRPDKSSPTERGVIEKTNLVRSELGLIPREHEKRFGLRYKGIVSFFRNTYQILFRYKKGKRRFIRWKEG